MNILWISSRYPPDLCGIGSYVYILTNKLSGKTNIILLVPERNIVTDRKIYFFKNYFNPFYFFYIVIKEKVDIIQTQLPEALYSNLLFLASVFFIKLFLPRIRFVVTVHEIEPYYYLKLKKFFIIFKVVKFLNNGFIFTNRNDLKLSGIKNKNKKVRIIPIFTSFNSPVSQALPNLRLPDKYGLYIGNIHHLKNLYPIIKVFSKFKNSDYYLIIAYGDIHTDIKIKLDELIEREGIKKKVLFFKGLDNSRIKYLIENAKFMILCYKNGITSRSSILMTALEYNKPYLAEIGNYTPLWLKKITKFYYEGDNENMIFKALTDLFSENFKYSLRYYQFFKDYFSVESIAYKYINFYKQIVEKNHEKSIIHKKFKIRR